MTNTITVGSVTLDAIQDSKNNIIYDTGIVLNLREICELTMHQNTVDLLNTIMDGINRYSITNAIDLNEMLCELYIHMQKSVQFINDFYKNEFEKANYDVTLAQIRDANLLLAISYDNGHIILINGGDDNGLE